MAFIIVNYHEPNKEHFFKSKRNLQFFFCSIYEINGYTFSGF